MVRYGVCGRMGKMGGWADDTPGREKASSKMKISVEIIEYVKKQFIFVNKNRRL